MLSSRQSSKLWPRVPGRHVACEDAMGVAWRCWLWLCCVNREALRSFDFRLICRVLVSVFCACA